MLPYSCPEDQRSDRLSTPENNYVRGVIDKMELKKLIYTVQDGIAIITMNYLKNLNAIDEPMADELLYVVDAAEKDPAVKVVVLKGSCLLYTSPSPRD